MKKIYTGLIVAGLLMIQNVSASEMLVLQKDLEALTKLEESIPKLEQMLHDLSITITDPEMAPELKKKAEGQLERVITMREQAGRQLAEISDRQRKLIESTTCSVVPQEREVMRLSGEISTKLEEEDAEMWTLVEKADLSSKIAEEWKEKSQGEKGLFGKLVDKAKECGLLKK